jgi:hypothetical protein
MSKGEGFEGFVSGIVLGAPPFKIFNKLSCRAWLTGPVGLMGGGGGGGCTESRVGSIFGENSIKSDPCCPLPDC